MAVAWPAFAGDRLRVAAPSNEEERVQQLIETLTAAITNEDFATYKSCFTKPAKAKYCKDAVIAFVTYDLEMEIRKWFVTTSTDSKTAFTIRYLLSRDGRETEFVSEVECVSANDRLLIRRETPRSVKSLTASDPWAEYSATCLGGQCQASGPNGGKKRGAGLPGQPDNRGAGVENDLGGSRHIPRISTRHLAMPAAKDDGPTVQTVTFFPVQCAYTV